jgi:hypothetical protein
MKRFSSILLAFVLGVLTVVSNLQAQTITGAAGARDWTNALDWGTPEFPGQNPNNLTSTFNPTGAIVMNNCGGIPNRVRSINIISNFGITLNGTGTLRIGTLNILTGTLVIGPGLNVIVDSLITGAANAAGITIRSGGQLTVTATFPNSYAPGGPQITAPTTPAARLVLGPGYNNGIFPVDAGALTLIAPAYAGSIEIQGNMRLISAYTRNAADGAIIFSNNARLSVAPGQTLTLNQTAIGSLTGTGTIQGEVGGTIALGAGFNGGNLPGANFANPFFGTINFTAPLNLVSDLTMGTAGGNASQQGTINLSAAASILTVTPGVTLTLNSTEPNTLIGLGFIATQPGGTIVLGPNFNNGFIPARFRAIQGTLRTIGNFFITAPPPGSFPVPADAPFIATTGTLRLGGNLNITGGGTLLLANSAPNSIVRDVPTAVISAQGPTTFLQLNPGFNNSRLDGSLISNPFEGTLIFTGSLTVSGTLVQSATGGPFLMHNHGTVITIDPNSEIALLRTSANAVGGGIGPLITGGLPASLSSIPYNTANGAVAVVANSVYLHAPSTYIQGVNSTSVLRLGVGFNAGVMPPGVYGNPTIAAGGANFAATIVPFLPLPTIAPVSTTTGGLTNAFKGRLVLEGSLTSNRDIRIDPVGSLELRGGNLTQGEGRILELYNQGANSFFGTGLIQGVAYGANALLHPFAISELPAPLAAAYVAGTLPGKVSLGPGFNGGVIPAARFGNPFLGTLDVSRSGPSSGIAPLTIQGNLVMGLEGGISHLQMGFTNFTTLARSNGNLIIAPNSSLRLNGINVGSLYDGNTDFPGPTVPGTIQATDISSRLILGQGHNGVSRYAVVTANVPLATLPVASTITTRTTSATFLAAPFNGTLEFLNQSVISTSVTIGVSGRLVVGAPTSLTTSTVQDAAGATPNRRWGFPPVAGTDAALVNLRTNPPTYYPIALVLNNQSANSLTGTGSIQAGTGNTIELGAGFNANILPGSRFNPSGIVGTLATAGPLTLQGVLTIGNSRDYAYSRVRTPGAGVSTTPPQTAAFGQFLSMSTGFLKLGANLTVDNGAILNVSNATVNAFTGVGVVDAEPTGQVNIVDGFNSVSGKNYNSVNAGLNFFTLGGYLAAPPAAPRVIPTRSNLDATNFASPFRGRLNIGAGLTDAPTAGAAGLGGLSQFTITNGTLTMGPTSTLIMTSPLTVSSATSTAPPGGFPRLVLNMTAANSLVGVTTGSVLNSSTGSYTQNPAINGNEVIYRLTGGGGQIVLGPGFNNSQIQAARFGNPFAGELVMPNSGTLDVIGDLNMLAPSLSQNAASTPWTVTRVDFGLLNLGSGSAILRVADGASLTLSTTANVNAAGANYTSPDGVTTPIFSVSGTGKITGATNNATIRLGATFGGFAQTGAGLIGASVSAVTAANFVQPFVGRLVITTSATPAAFVANNPVAGATLNGSFTLGASGSTDGVLDIVNASGTVFVGSGSNLQINNTSPVAIVLPGAGRLNAVDNTAQITIGPSALTNVLPGSRLQSPFVGQLVTAPGTTPLTLDANFILAGDQPGIATDDAINGILRLNAPLRMLSGVTLGFNNFRPGALTGTGTISATDQTSVVRLCTGFNGYVIPGNSFSNPWNGTILGNWHDPAGTPIVPLNPHATLAMTGTEFGDYAAGYAPIANAVGGAGAYYHLIGNLTLGAAGSSNGFLDLRGNSAIAATYPINGDLFLSSTDGNVAVVSGVTIDRRTTVATLTVNNILPVAQVLPGTGLLQSRGREKGTGANPLPASSLQLNHYSSSLVFGANGLNNIFPAAKLGPISGNVFTPASPVTANAGNITFERGGTLVVGGTTATVGTGASLTIPAGNTYTFLTEHARALTGIGQLLAGSTSSTISFGRGVTPAATNRGEIPASNIGPHFGGQLVVQDATVMTLRNGQLRLGDGTGSSGRFQIGTTVGAGAGAQLVIGTNATLDLRQQNPNVIMVGSQLITAQDSTSKLILGPSFNLSRFQAETNPAGGGVMSNLVGSPFMGVLITSTGSLTLNNSLTIGASLPIWINGPTGLTASQTPVAGGPSNLPRGGLELGGELIIPAGVVLTYSATTATSFRGTLGSNGYININPAANGATPAAGVYGEFIFNGTDLTNNAATAPANAGIVPTQLFGIRALNTTSTTRATVGFNTGTARLTVSRGNYELADFNTPVTGTVGTGLRTFGDLQVNTRTRLNIPRNSRLDIATAFVPALVSTGGFQTSDNTNRGAITASDSTATLAFVEGLLPDATAPVGSGPAGSYELNAFTPTIGSGATGFQGRLLLNRFNSVVNGITVTMGTASIFENNANVTLGVAGGQSSVLNLNNQGATTFRSASGTTAGFITSTLATSRVNLGTGFNAGILPGDRFGAGGVAYLGGNLPRTNPFQGRITIASDQTLSSRLNIGATGGFDFGTGTAKLIVGSFGTTNEGELLNATSARYFVTNGSGYAALGQVGNVTFPVGPSTTVYSPIFISNNAAPSVFGVRANSPIAPIVAPAAATGSPVLQPAVGIRWSVEQRNNIAPGIAVTTTPQWPSTQEGAGFNRTIAVVHRFTGTTLSASSAPAVAPAVPGLTNYFQSSLVTAQTAAPGSLTTSTELIVTSQPQPAILSFTPASAASSQTVTIVGSRFVNVSAVRFGGVNASSFTVVSPDTIRAIVSASGATGPITVVQTGGTATSASNFTFLGVPPQTPIIRDVNRSATTVAIPAGLGDFTATINGTGFGSMTVRVAVAGSGAQGVVTPTANSATAITFNIPGQFTRNVGTVTLTVTSTDKLPVSTNVNVVVAPATTITLANPTSVNGNLTTHTVQLTGTAFGQQSSFSLNGLPLRVLNFTTNPNGTVTATVEIPVGANSGDIVVTNLNNTTGRIPFTVNNLPRPIITGVNPVAIAPGSPATLVTIAGQNFIPGATVTFNGTPIANVTTSSTSVQFVVPAALLANADLATIRVSNPDNQAIGYRFPISTGGGGTVFVPTDNTGNILSSSVTPSTTTATGSAFQLTVSGSGFAQGLTASLGGMMLTVVSVTPTQVVLNVPASANVAGRVQLNIANTPANSFSGFYTIGAAAPNPATGLIAVQSGNRIIITGNNIAPGAVVTFGQPPVTLPTTVDASGRVIATLPQGVVANTYPVTVTNPGAAASSTTVIISVSVRSERIAATRVYPNPTVDMVVVEANLERSAEVVINVTNTLGQSIMTVRQNAAAGFFTKSLNVQNLPSGAYTIEITDGTRRSVEKIIKN